MFYFILFLSCTANLALAECQSSGSTWLKPKWRSFARSLKRLSLLGRGFWLRMKAQVSGIYPPNLCFSNNGKTSSEHRRWKYRGTSPTIPTTAVFCQSGGSKTYFWRYSVPRDSLPKDGRRASSGWTFERAPYYSWHQSWQGCCTIGWITERVYHPGVGWVGWKVCPVQERWVSFCQVALRPEDWFAYSILSGYAWKCKRSGSLCVYLSTGKYAVPLSHDTILDQSWSFDILIHYLHNLQR